MEKDRFQVNEAPGQNDTSVYPDKACSARTRNRIKKAGYGQITTEREC